MRQRMLRRFLLRGAAATAALWLGAASAQVEAPTSLAGVSARDADIFIVSAYLALSYANIRLQMDGKAPLYCPSGNTPSAAGLWQMVDVNLTGPHEASMIVLALIDELVARSPC